MSFTDTREQIEPFNCDLFPMKGVLFRKYIRKYIKICGSISKLADILPQKG